MPAQLADDPILKRFRSALDEMYGDRIERVVLFGSRARGEAREDSDYDVAVFLRGFADRWQEIDRIIPPSARSAAFHSAARSLAHGGASEGVMISLCRTPYLRVKSHTTPSRSSTMFSAAR
jgi:hypothetical protein